MVHWTIWSTRQFSAQMDHMEHWTIWCTEPFSGHMDHMMHWTIWSKGPFSAHMDHMVQWTIWSTGPFCAHLDQLVHYTNCPCKKNISSSLYPPILPSPSSLLPSLFSPFHSLFYLSGMYVVISLHYLLCFNTYLIYGDSNRGCCGESAQLYQ